MASWRSAGTRRSNNAANRPLWRHVLLPVLLLSAGPVHAQTAPAGPEKLKAESDQLQAKITEVARGLQSNPRLKKLSQQQREKVVEFITGNMLFVMLHELAHATVTDFNIPVLGREEDAADDFAVLRLLQVGSEFSHRILVEAAEGWFLSDKRDQQEGDKPDLSDEHSLDKQRAFHIVCLMVGSDPKMFTDLANETKLPADRQATCPRDYATVARSWDMVLKPYRRTADQPKIKIEAVYGDPKGKYDAYAQGFRSVRLLEVAAERTADILAWPAPFTLETQTCGGINAQWVAETRKLTLCYELAADFAELYRDFGSEPPTSKKRKSKR
jgi:Putative metallopeptidase